ncbi:universal stress protein [Nocardia sp. NPDC001965]
MPSPRYRLPDSTVTTETTDVLIGAALIGRSFSLRMLVAGSRGMGAFQRGLLGSVSTAVTRHARCPVAVVHADTPLDAVSAGRPVLPHTVDTPMVIVRAASRE